MKRIAIISIMCLTTCLAWAVEVEVNGIMYNVDIESKTAKVVYKESKYEGSIVIPSSILVNDVECSVTSIGEQAFDRCSSLISVTIPEGVTIIEKDAFACCFDLSSVTFPSTLTRIGDDAFNSCYSLTTISIPSSVTSIGYRAFKDCAFLTSLVIPEGVTDISHSAFSGCSGLTSVTIPSSVSKLEYDTFRDCTGLTDVYCYAVTAPAATLAFEQSHIESVTLHVPASTIEDYKSTEPWNQFGTIVALDTTTSYHPLAKEGKVWNFQSSIPIFNNERLYYSYIIKGDTIINDKKYKKLYFRHSKINLYTAALRDEGSRAYIIPADSTREFVYYDLNTEELVDMAYGQSAKPYLSGSHGPEKIMSHGLSLWRVYWTLQPMAFHTLFSWIESIGAMEDYFKSPFIFSYSDEMDVSKYSGGIGTLISCFEDGKCIYGNEKAALDDHFVPVSLTYEAKEGLNHARSNVWAVVRNNMIIFYFNNVQDHFVFSEEQSGQIYRDNLTGTMFTCARLLDEETHRLYPDLKFSYRLESDYEVFTIDIATGIHEPDYRPFVERGKSWYVHKFNAITNEHDALFYTFSADKNLISIDGHEYLKMTSRYAAGREYLTRDREEEEKIVGLFREEDKKVYYRQSADETEQLVYDFSLNVGDEFMFPPERADEAILKVTALGKTILADDTLKTISFNTVAEPTWIEGIGYTSWPLGFMPIPPNGDHYVTAYVGYVGRTNYLPLTFSEPYLGWWGTDLTRVRRLDTGIDDYPANDSDSLSYELVPDPKHNGELSLHVSGQMWTHSGPHNYVYCVSEQEEDTDVKQIRLIKEPLLETEEIGFFQVDFSFPHFPKGKYIAVDNRGEHPVTISNGADYRPFIEEGKVWKTGWINYIENTIDGFIYHYFDGDSIIAGKYCKKMMRRYEYAPQLQEFGYKSGTEYIGALCEEGKKVYLAYSNSERWLLIYDFDSPVGSTIHFFDTDNQVMTSGIISEVKMIYNDTYHGRVTSIERLANNNYVEYGQWKEGVGHHCLQNIDNGIDTDDGHGFLFISCTVGDEVLYYDAFLANDTTLNNTTIGDVKKQQLDFTHVVKPRPKAPRQGVSEASEEEVLTGEYSTKELFVNFKPLAGAYAITICDANGKEVYRKEVQTSNVVGLNTDISGYGKGEYTITVENDAEKYTATFSIGNEDGIRIPTSDLSRGEKANAVYDLSGRQIANSELPISKLPRGIYIRGGKKVVVK